MNEGLSTGPIRADGWQQACTGQMASLFASTPWWDAMEAEYGYSPQVTSIGGFRSGIAWERVDDARGARLRSLPFSDMACGPMSTTDWPVLLGSLGDGTEPTLVWSLFDGPEVEGWAKDQPAVWQGLKIDADREELLMRLRATCRSRVRNCDRVGFDVVSPSTHSAIDEFFELHLGVRKYKHSLLPQGRSLFHHQLDAFGDDLRVIQVVRDGGVEAAAVTILWDGVLYYKYSASSPEYRNEGVNHRLVFGVAELALELGVSTVDLGRSDLDQDGLVQFKKGFGAISEPLFRYRRSGNTSIAADELGATLGRLTSLYVDPSVPDEITEAAGAELYRYFA